MQNSKAIDQVATKVGRRSEKADSGLRAEITEQIVQAMRQLEELSWMPWILQRNLADGNVEDSGGADLETVVNIMTIGNHRLNLPRSFAGEVENELVFLIDPTDNTEFKVTRVTPEFLQDQNLNASNGKPKYYTIGIRQPTAVGGGE